MANKSKLKAGATLPSARLQAAGSTKVLLRESDGGVVKRTVLPGGLRVLTESMPSTRSVSIGVWVGVGSRDETPEMAGSAHFLEHLLFKGTKSRNAFEISAPLEAVGSDFNAFTTKEYTAYHAQVLAGDTELAIEIMADMMLNSLLTPADFKQEQGVILEEIAMRQDDHADTAHEAFVQGMFGATDLGRPTLGTVRTINAADRNRVWKFYKQHYRPNRLVIAAAGAVDHAELVRMVKRHFAKAIGGNQRPAERRQVSDASIRKSALKVVGRDTEQSHLFWGVPALSRDDDRRFAASMLSTALGGGMSSRLFQEVREQRGLAYSVYTFLQSYADAGYFGVYCGSIPQRMPAAMAQIESIMNDVKRNGVADSDIERARGQMRGGLVMGLEDPGARMTRIAKAELVSGELRSIETALELISDISGEQVSAVAGELLQRKPTIGIVGPYSGAAEFRQQMQGSAK